MRNGARALGFRDGLLCVFADPRNLRHEACPKAMWNITRNAAAGLVIAALLCACGSSDKSAQSQAAAARNSHKVLSPAQTLARNMVSAATQTKPGSAPIPLQVKFALRARPDVAQPLDIDLQLVPTASNLDRIFGKVEGDEGLELVGSDELAEAEKPVENTPIDRSIKVLPKRNGIYLVTAIVSVDMGGQISTQTFQIPVIAGPGIPDLPVKPAAPTRTTASTAASPWATSRR